MRFRPFVPALSVLLFITFLRADEIRLKDGSKVTGTIVAVEGDSFKVQTSYGFAMIRRDSIAQIIPGEAKKAAAPAAAEPASSEKQALEPASEKSPVLPPKPVEESKTPAPGSGSLAPAKSMAVMKPIPPPVTPPTPKPNIPPNVPVSTPKPTAPPAEVSTPASVPESPKPEPEPIRETIRGNLYINETFGFQMFRPPGWDLIANASSAMPNAITALGTSDQATLLVIGHDVLTGSLEAQAAVTDRRLRDIYENFRLVSTQTTTIAGSRAIETRISGSLDGRDWSVTAVTLGRGSEAFTLLAMTSANSDLIQIQENIISRAISSLEFSAAPSK